MTWTYGGDPSANDRDWIRFRIGDTKSHDPLLTDEEIAGLLTLNGASRVQAAIAAMRALILEFSRKVDRTAGEVSDSHSQRVEQFRQALADMEAESSRAAAPLVGGISKARKETVEDDADRVVPRFRRDQFRNRRSRDDPNDPNDC